MSKIKHFCRHIWENPPEIITMFHFLTCFLRNRHGSLGSCAAVWHQGQRSCESALRKVKRITFMNVQTNGEGLQWAGMRQPVQVSVGSGWTQKDRSHPCTRNTWSFLRRIRSVKGHKYWVRPNRVDKDLDWARGQTDDVRSQKSE